jgi:hypothetical protein
MHIVLIVLVISFFLLAGIFMWMGLDMRGQGRYPRGESFVYAALFTAVAFASGGSLVLVSIQGVM